MDITILDSFDFKLDLKEVMDALYMDEDSDDFEDIQKFVRIANEIGRPKVMYKESFIDVKGNDYVVIDGVKLSSHILRTNLDSAERVFPYICTCGIELNEWADTLDDMIEEYWADKIMEIALQRAIAAFTDHIKDTYGFEPSSNMNPGSLEDWPISQQKELFGLLGSPKKDVGVELTESFLMVPIKSLSGIRFASDTDFVNCSLCPRERCENRRMEYDAHLKEKYEK